MISVKIRGNADQVPVGSIFCIGRNYVEHAAELNNPVPKSPLIFTKPATTLVHDGGKIVLPTQSQDVHHEVELVLLIGNTGKHISEGEAFEYIQGVGIGIDVTARDIQQVAKDKSHPWAVAKGFDTFAPVSEFITFNEVDKHTDFEVTLAVNGSVRQHGFTRDLIFPFPKLISYLSNIFTLRPGDLIFTGTPAGVGRLNDGDQLVATLNPGEVTLRVGVTGHDFSN